MNKPTGKLAFAYQTIARLEHQLAEARALNAGSAVPDGYVLLPEKCPSWLEDAYDGQCQADCHYEPGLYLPAYDAMVAMLASAPTAKKEG